MAEDNKFIRILVEGEPEHTFLKLRIIEKYHFCFPRTNFEVITMGSKSTHLSDVILFRNFLLLRNPNMICFFIPDFHPMTCHRLDHSSLNALRKDIHDKLERIQTAHNIPDYKKRFLIHTFKHGGDVIFLANLEILFRELDLHDEEFFEEIQTECNLSNLEELTQDPTKDSHEKRLLKKIFRRVDKSYTIKHYHRIIGKLRIETLVNRLPHLKMFLSELFDFADEEKVPQRLKDLLS